MFVMFVESEAIFASGETEARRTRLLNLFSDPRHVANQQFCFDSFHFLQIEILVTVAIFPDSSPDGAGAFIG